MIPKLIVQVLGYLTLFVSLTSLIVNAITAWAFTEVGDIRAVDHILMAGVSGILAIATSWVIDLSARGGPDGPKGA